MTINTDLPGTVSGFLSISSLGDVPSNRVPFAISVCETPLLKVKEQLLGELIKPVFNLNEGEDGKVIIPESVYSRFVDVNKCQVC